MAQVSLHLRPPRASETAWLTQDEPVSVLPFLGCPGLFTQIVPHGTNLDIGSAQRCAELFLLFFID